jgi:hypothetical protein
MIIWMPMEIRKPEIKENYLVQLDDGTVEFAYFHAPQLRWEIFDMDTHKYTVLLATKIVAWSELNVWVRETRTAKQMDDAMNGQRDFEDKTND